AGLEKKSRAKEGPGRPSFESAVVHQAPGSGWTSGLLRTPSAVSAPGPTELPHTVARPGGETNRIPKIIGRSFLLPAILLIERVNGGPHLKPSRTRLDESQGCLAARNE